MLTELREGVWWVECTGVNAYLVADGDGVTLVDAGTLFDDARLEAAVGEAGYDREDVERVLVTHYDVDHVGAIPKLAIDAPVYVGRADAGYVTGEDRPPLGFPKPLVQLVGGLLLRDVPADRVRTVDDGGQVGGFTALAAPGHTPGHTVYVHEDRDAAFLGDAVVERNGALRPSPWLLSYDVEAVRESIREVADRAGEFDVAAMGHGTPFGRNGSDRLRDLAETL